MRELGCEVVDAGFISDAQEGAAAAEKLRAAGCDLIVGFLTTYMTATMLLPVAQRSGAPVLLINLQPTESMDHDTFDTGQWLAYCGACPLPEMANTFIRAGIPFRSVSGYLEDERAWAKIGRWVRAAGVRASLRHGRHGLMGHLYPGMLDVATDLTLVPVQPRRARRGAGVRRPAGTRGAGHRRRGQGPDGAGPRGVRAGRHASSPRTSRGRRGSRPGSTGWWPTSSSTASPTTTADSTARSTNGSAPA